MGLLRNRRKSKIARRGTVQQALESIVDESKFSEEELKVLHENYEKIMSIAEDRFPKCQDDQELQTSLQAPTAKQTYGSIITIIMVIKILMTLYNVWKAWKAEKQ